MASPNIVNVATITGKTAVQLVGASATALITNAASSSTVLKVNALYVSNVSAAAATITADIYRSSTAYRFAYMISVPVGTTLDILSKSVYLEEGDTLRLTAGTISALEAVGSYEIIA
jgi:stress response protein SCP2